MTGSDRPAGNGPAGDVDPAALGISSNTAAYGAGVGIRLLDLTGRERQLRSAMLAMAKVAVVFTRSARRTLPFLVRQRARITPSPVDILHGATVCDGPTMEATLEADDGVGWGAILLDTGALSVILEGALGGRETSAATELGPELTLAQRALVGRVARSLASDFANAVREEAGLPLRVAETRALAAGEQREVQASDGLYVTCSFEGLSVQGAVMIAACAESLEASVREHEAVEEPIHGDPRIAEALTAIDVEVVAELGRVTVGLRRVLSMQVGDVLRLPTAIDDPIPIRVATVTKLLGAPVISRGQLSVEIKGRHGA